MYLRRLLQLSALTLIFLTGCAQSDKAPIPAFQNNTSSFQENQLRLTVVKDTARSVGAQAGLAWTAQKTNALLESQSKELYRTFNFQEMMLSNNVMPPVLQESNNDLNLDSDTGIRLADRVYEIVKPAHFVTTIPSWRDYLLMPFNKPEAPNIGLMPKTDQEKEIWNKYTVIGWNEGITQARDIFTMNLSRLTRDYRGMILYRKLLAQNIVTPPYISKADLGVTGGGNNLRINDRVLRITAVAELQPNSKVWKSRIYKQGQPFVPQSTTKPKQSTKESKKTVVKCTPKKSTK